MRRRAKVRLDEQMLEMMLDLPENNRVVGVQSRMDPFGVEVIIEGPDLPEVPPNAEAPFVQGVLQRRSDGGLGLELIWPDAQPVPDASTQAHEFLVDFATWLSEQEDLDVDTPDHAVDRFLRHKDGGR